MLRPLRAWSVKKTLLETTIAQGAGVGAHATGMRRAGRSTAHRLPARVVSTLCTGEQRIVFYCWPPRSSRIALKEQRTHAAAVPVLLHTKMSSTASSPAPAVKAYLVAYNFAQAAGWTLCLAATAAAAASGAGVQQQFLAGAPYARWMQCIAFVEVLHAAAGIVPSSPVSNFWQWLGRANALFKFAVGIPELQQSPWAVVMLMCWSLGEMIRYPWYRATLLNACPHWLTWLRYTAFIALYPVGVVAEMLLLFWGVAYVRERGLYSIRMPNAWNFAWDYAIFIQVMLLLYPYLWWGNFSSLLRQRTKKLAPAAAQEQQARDRQGGASASSVKAE